MIRAEDRSNNNGLPPDASLHHHLLHYQPEEESLVENPLEKQQRKRLATRARSAWSRAQLAPKPSNFMFRQTNLCLSPPYFSEESRRQSLNHDHVVLHYICVPWSQITFGLCQRNTCTQTEGAFDVAPRRFPTAAQSFCLKLEPHLRSLAKPSLGDTTTRGTGSRMVRWSRAISNVHRSGKVLCRAWCKPENVFMDVAVRPSTSTRT